MNIEEIRQHRVEAERVIFEVLSGFKEKTGLTIVGCDVETYNMKNVNGLYELSPVCVVRLKIEPI